MPAINFNIFWGGGVSPLDAFGVSMSFLKRTPSTPLAQSWIRHCDPSLSKYTFKRCLQDHTCTAYMYDRVNTALGDILFVFIVLEHVAH